MRRFTLVCGLLFPLLALAFAPDISGKWSGTIAVMDEASGTLITTPVELQISQQDSTISGKIGRAKDSDPVPIVNARIEGNKVYFEAASDETTGPCKFSLTITGDQMEGNMSAAIDNTDITGAVKVSRAKH